MTGRVDFYVLKSSTPKQRWTFACRLTEKAYLRDLRVLLLSDTAGDAEAIDELLWTFDERSFVPHEVRRAAAAEAGADATADGAATVPVQLTPDLEGVGTADLLVNLSDRMPLGCERFARIAEIIDADVERRAKGRERFKVYRDMRLAVETHHAD